MAWTEKKEKFCLAFMESGNQSEAYRTVYNTKNMGPATINNEASKLFNSHEITVRLEELRAPIRERAGLTLESHLDKLAELRDAALASEQFGASITAETNRGKASGLYVERVEQSGPGGKPIENKWTVEVVSAQKE
jgi:hypothetical protein